MKLTSTSTYYNYLRERKKATNMCHLHTLDLFEQNLSGLFNMVTY